MNILLYYIKHEMFKPFKRWGDEDYEYIANNWNNTVGWWHQYYDDYTFCQFDFPQTSSSKPKLRQLITPQLKKQILEVTAFNPPEKRVSFSIHPTTPKSAPSRMERLITLTSPSTPSPTGNMFKTAKPIFLQKRKRRMSC